MICHFFREPIIISISSGVTGETKNDLSLAVDM